MTVDIGKIYTFKMNSGEELVAKIFCEPVGNCIVVMEPVSIAPSKQGLQLIPSMFTSEPNKSVTINTNSVAMFAETESGVKDQYIELTTGIKVPPEKKIILG